MILFFLCLNCTNKSVTTFSGHCHFKTVIHSLYYSIYCKLCMKITPFLQLRNPDKLKYESSFSKIQAMCLRKWHHCTYVHTYIYTSLLLVACAHTPTHMYIHIYDSTDSSTHSSVSRQASHLKGNTHFL
jgi:hypothetical protein